MASFSVQILMQRVLREPFIRAEVSTQSTSCYCFLFGNRLTMVIQLHNIIFGIDAGIIVEGTWNLDGVSNLLVCATTVVLLQGFAII